MYYSYERILTYNAFLNFLIRRKGRPEKRMAGVKFCISKFLKKGEQFIYLRRYKSDLKKSVPTFFDAIIKNNEFPDAEFKIRGNTFYINDKLAGFNMALSTAQDIKGANFDNVKFVLFDEFIIDEGVKKYYLSNEVEVFLNIIESIARMRDVKIFLLGNARKSSYQSLFYVF